MRHAAQLIFLAGLSAALAGCSSLSGTEAKRTHISTNPPDAQCVIAGNGYRQVVRTPEFVAPPLDVSPLKVTCTAPGHRQADGLLRVRFNDRMLGNLSSIGLAIDMMNGQDTAYPRTLRIHMEPVSFRTAAARDAWYGRFRDHVAEKWDRAISMRSLGCSETDSGYGCVEAVDALNAGRGRELAMLESRRLGAHVIGETVAEEPHPLPRMY